MAPPAWAVLQPSGIRSGTEEELTDGDSSSPDEATPPTEPGMPPPEAPDYVSLERRRAFCQHVVTLTAREWAVEDPAYNEVLDRIRTGPDAYPAPLQEIYRDCLDGFLRRGITEGEVDCTLRSGSLAEIENCGTGR
ncbi:MAG: hypothetical protein FJ098_11935 [Deltaproteobacteria bacterium]|nr:hypothetical protein [Deltaproteobacteria bacterium]